MDRMCLYPSAIESVLTAFRNGKPGTFWLPIEPAFKIIAAGDYTFRSNSIGTSEAEAADWMRTHSQYRIQSQHIVVERFAVPAEGFVLYADGSVRDISKDSLRLKVYPPNFLEHSPVDDVSLMEAQQSRYKFMIQDCTLRKQVIGTTISTEEWREITKSVSRCQSSILTIESQKEVWGVDLKVGPIHGISAPRKSLRS